MRLAKLAAIVSMWTFFFGFLVLVHLSISVLGLPNRWAIISGLTFLLRAILNIKVGIIGDAGHQEEVIAGFP